LRDIQDAVLLADIISSVEHLACQHLLTHPLPEVRREADSPSRFAVFSGPVHHPLHPRNFTFIALVAANVCRLCVARDDLGRMAY